jgi:hypothetical protein
MSVPHHPRYGERWFECSICGLDFPYHMGTRHYLSNRLVDPNCNDLKTQSDYLKDMVLPFEKRVISEQPVKCQGEVAIEYWYDGEWYDAVWYGDEPCSGGSQ